ncbi:outer membrane lipoprotein-sorting protein [Vibrio sp. 404]|uniref:Outer membrane lipoprotein-sorting protein n=1 Tax=Vibrio marinisediminis TaxID=2758441 RepID=A0A7W2ISM5_9VIBR|nr:outer membrane lipoprotein-sorting protein [Vibrio marinisediminis]MBA5761691.1 outer membrane lipoprotein-sorting protein [Vibrio marinisediminis]
MSNIKTLFASLLISMMMTTPSKAALNTSQVKQLIETADQFRLGEESARVISVVSLYKAGELDKTRQYNVYSRPNRESLVVFKSSVEAGQKMLMLQENFWLQMPKSRRPIRITPMQKLLGEASVGDISSLTWSEDYQGKWLADETAKDINQLPYSAHHIELTAKTSSASYQRIELWIEQETSFPIRADLYLRSGKLAKQAYFARGVRDDKLAVTAMTLLDAIQPTKKTVIKYMSIEPWKLEDKFYNPSFLARNNTAEL